MLSAEQMKKLKRANVSVDAAKTMERFKEDFRKTSAEQKRGLAEVSGQALNSFYRVGSLGTVSVRLALALANEFNVSPFFYTGESDDRGHCSNILIRQFLEKHGYSDIAAELSSSEKKKRPYNRKPKIDAAPVIINEDVTNEQDNDCCCETQDECCAVETDITLTEDEAVLLLKALYVRAKAGGNAAINLACVKKCLLS